MFDGSNAHWEVGFVIGLVLFGVENHNHLFAANNEYVLCS